MKKREVEIGGVYLAKITNRVVQVRIDAVSRYGGWDGTNLDTQKKVRIHSPAKLRSALSKIAKPIRGKAEKNPQGRRKRDTAQTVASESQPAAIVCPNCGGTEIGEEGDCKKCHEPDLTQQAVAKSKKPQKSKSDRPKRMSALDAAAKVLEAASEPMSAKQIIEMSLAKGYWKSPGGKTPQATLYSAMLREIIAKGDQSRFRKTERGKFVRA